MKSTLPSLSVLDGRLLVVIIITAALFACDSEHTPAPPVDRTYTIDAVPADGILETVTWNLEWYGSQGNGPTDEDQQTLHALQVMDSLQADLYALQEISSGSALGELTSRMEGYRGFTADYITYNQRMAFIYNTTTIDSLSAGPITELQDEEYAWAGRTPLCFRFTYHADADDTPVSILAIVIHGKANDQQESYQRRMRAARSLYRYLMEQEAETNIIFLGDYNDDVDQSIYSGAETPYAPFIAQAQNFTVITRTLSDSGQSSTIGYPDMIDHITASNEMMRYYLQQSARVYTPVIDFIPEYARTTSDHYPVVARFGMTP